MIWDRKKELKALPVQHKELLSRPQEENPGLREGLTDAERGLRSLLKASFPELYHGRRPSGVL